MMEYQGAGGLQKYPLRYDSVSRHIGYRHEENEGRTWNGDRLYVLVWAGVGTYEPRCVITVIALQLMTRCLSRGHKGRPPVSFPIAPKGS